MPAELSKGICPKGTLAADGRGTGGGLRPRAVSSLEEVDAIAHCMLLRLETSRFLTGVHGFRSVFRRALVRIRLEGDHASHGFDLEAFEMCLRARIFL